LDGIAGDRLLERELELVAQIRTAVHLRAAAGTGAEDVAEDIAEDVAERICTAETVRAEAAGRADAGMSESVVRRALAVVRQDLVGLLGLLELRFGLRIVRIAIRVIFHRQAAVRLLYVVGTRTALHAEHFVVIALGHSFDHPLGLRSRTGAPPARRRRLSPKTALDAPIASS